MADFWQTDFARRPSAAEIEEQVRWEIAAVEEGVKRYWRSLEASDDRGAPAAADVPAGMVLMRPALREFATFLAGMQAVIREDYTSSRTGNRPVWHLYACALPPETLAYLTIRAVFGERPCDDVVGARKVSSCARILTTSIKAEIDYRDWIVSTKGKAKEEGKTGAAYQDLLEVLRRGAKMNTKHWRRIKARLKAAASAPWREQDRTLFGGAMIHHLVEHCGGLFTLTLVPIARGKSELYVRISDKARALLTDHHARAEVARPLDRPMLCPPKPWTWQPKEG